MLLPPDAELARRDAAIPGLGLLLDPEAFTDALRAALPHAGVESARARYVRYKPGTNCLVAYQLEVAGAQTDVYAKAYRTGTRGKLRKARARFAGCSALGSGGIVLDDAVTVVFAFPNDYKLSTLASLADPRSRQRLLAGLLPQHPDLWEAALRGLRYKPERRYVARMVAKTGESALVKFYAAHGDYLAANRAASAFESQGALRLARWLGASADDRAVALEWLPGRPLDEIARDPRFDVAVARTVGAALARLHAQNAPGLGRLTREAETATLLAAAGAVGAVYPPLAERARGLACRIAAGLRDVPYQARPIHGDFAADQVLLTETGVAILDLDEAAQGDPASDLGSFTARMERDALRGDLPAHRARALTEAFLAGYCAACHADLPPHFSLHVAAGLLRVAPHAFRNREPEWPARTRAILGRAEEIANNERVYS